MCNSIKTRNVTRTEVLLIGAQKPSLFISEAITGLPLHMTCEYPDANLGFSWYQRTLTSPYLSSVGTIYNTYNNVSCVPPVPSLEPNPKIYSYSCLSLSKQRLTIRNVTMDNHGEQWSCGAYPVNGGRLDSNVITFNVKVPITKLDISPKLDQISLLVNQTVQLTCTSDFGRPTPVINWFMDNATSHELDDFNITHLSAVTTMSENVTISTLTLKPSKPDNNTRVYCSGNNGGSDRVFSSMKPSINILFGPSQPEFYSNGSLVVGSIVALSGKSILLTCTSISSPAPSFTWTYPGGTTSGQNLVITSIGTTFEGNYTCNARNTMTPSLGTGRSETTNASIFVQVNVPIIYIELVTPASNIVFLKENDSILFECVTSSGKPVAVIKWYKDNRTPENNMDDVELSYASVKSLPDNVTKSVLNYTAKRVDDDMKIYCTGINTGETLASNRHAQLIITSFPEAPSSVAVSEISARSVRISWLYLSTGRMFQQFIVEVNEDGGEWIEQTVSTAFFNLSSSTVYSDLTLLKELTRYRIRVYAENVFGRSGPSDIVSFTTSSVDVSGSDLPNTSSQSFSMGAISGGVVGGVILGLFLGILGSWIVVIWRTRTSSHGGTRPGPQITSEYLSGSDDAYSSIPPNPTDRNQRVNPPKHAQRGSRISSAGLSGSDDPYSALPPNQADINQRVNQSRPSQGHEQGIHPTTGAAYENVVGNGQMEINCDANVKQETQPGETTTTAMYESLTHDLRGKEEYEMIKPSHK
ncbi:hypothetical protein DPMN_151306 [Dreissena polymorpha]|uniref:Uncharacterized protein n=2 Tax=Dreissena polymorpha TaxID=45954 RepID=A0A9D4J6C8_DREPO|nr:hypothetical protein DPMN_151306 [Dreissena polymorpha]